MNNLVREVQPVPALAQDGLGAKAGTGCTSGVGAGPAGGEKLFDRTKSQVKRRLTMSLKPNALVRPDQFVNLSVAFGLAP